MVVVIQLNNGGEEIRNLRELHVFFDRNTMQFHFNNEQDMIETLELDIAGFPDSPFNLIIRQ